MPDPKEVIIHATEPVTIEPQKPQPSLKPATPSAIDPDTGKPYTFTSSGTTVQTIKYPCGCTASGPGALPHYCPQHGVTNPPPPLGAGKLPAGKIWPAPAPKVVSDDPWAGKTIEALDAEHLAAEKSVKDAHKALDEAIVRADKARWMIHNHPDKDKERKSKPKE